MSDQLDSNEMAIEWIVNKVRTRLLDKAELNELIGKEEIGNLEIASAIEDTISEFNSMDPPIGSFTIFNFPSQEILILGTMSKVLMSGALLHWRNSLQFSAGGLSVDTHSMGQHYERIGGMMYSKFHQMSDMKKRQINVAKLLNQRAGLGSDYGLLNWYSSRLQYGSSGMSTGL